MRSTRFLATAAAGLLAGCMLPAPPPSAPPPEITPGAATARPTSALLAPYAGLYSGAGETVTVRLAGDTLLVERRGAAPVPLRLVGSGTFADAGGATWLFTTRGAATRLTRVDANGTRREWTR